MRLNPVTGKWEDDNGNEIPMAPPPGMAANQPLAPSPMMPAPAAGALPPQVQAPPPLPPLVRESQSTTTSREVPLAGERDAMKRLQATDDESVKIAGQKGEVEKLKAQQGIDATQMQLGAREETQQQTTGLADQSAAAVAKAKAAYDSENAKLSKMEVKDFWADKSVGQKVAAAIGLAMSGFGAALAGRGGGGGAFDVLDKLIDNDYRLQRAQIDMQERRVAGAKEGLGVVRQDNSDARERLELETAAKWNTIAAKVQAQAAQNGTPEAQAKAAEIVNLAEQKKAQRLQGWFETQRSKVSSTSNSSQGPGAAGAAGKASSEDLEKLGTLDNDIKNLDRVIDTIKKNPKAWDEYRKNQESWSRAEALGKAAPWLRGAAQAAGGMDVAPEQGLKTPDGKFIYQSVAKAKTGIAKGYGGAITGGDLDAAGSEVTTLANDPGQAVDTFIRLRGRMANSREVYLKNRNVQANPTAPAPAGPSAKPQLSPAERSELENFVRMNPGDPRAERAKRLLTGM